MAALLTYILKVTSLLAIVWLFYFLALRRHTFYGANRWYFLAGIVVAFLLPVLSFPAAISQNGLVQETVRQLSETGLYLLLAETAPSQSTTLMSATEAIVWPINVGIILFFGRLCLRVLSFFRLKRNAQKQTVAGAPVYVVNENISPFSFFGNIFLSTRRHTGTEMAEIIIHEQAHIRQRHIVDLLLVEIVAALCWFNPFAWLLRGAVRQNLEYLADREVLNAGFDTAHYQYNLVRTSVSIDGIAPVGNSFIFSNLKKRIIMMNKKRSSHIALLKYVLVVPLACFAWIALHAGELSDRLNEVAVITQEQPVQQKSQERFIQNLPTEKEWETTSNLLSNTSDTVKKIAVSKFTSVTRMDEKALYILDGKEISAEELKDLDQQNIADISILKGESAIQLYGEKGKNGVVIINMEKDPKKKVTTKNSSSSTKVGSFKIISKGEGSEPLYILNEKEISADAQKANASTTKIYSKTTIVGDGEKVDKSPLFIINSKVVTTAELKGLGKKNNIKSISILKDSTAVKLYGARAKDGVVVISTDSLKGKQGDIKISAPKEISKSKSIQLDGFAFVSATSNDNKPNSAKIFSISDVNHILEGENADNVMFVLDGKEISSTEKLNHEDIDSITVLKDEASIKLYGEKAKNGVIVITSKAAAEKKNKSKSKK